MKTMWTSEGGVSQVTVREENGVLLACDDEGPWFDPQPGTLHETEADAKRAWLAEEEAKVDNRIAKIDAEMARVSDELTRLKREADALIIDFEQAVKGRGAVRAQLAELDAVEGRR
jgi:hypothetical protein